MYAADALVEHGPGRERQALVGHLLGDDVLEDVRLVGLPVERDEVDGAQGAEILAHGVRRAELRIDAAGASARGTPARRTLATLSVRRGDSSSVSMRLRIRLCRLPGASSARRAASSLQVDALAAHVVEQLLDVERVALRARRHQLDQRRRRVGARAEELLELGRGSAARRPPARARSARSRRTAAGGRGRARRPARSSAGS